MAVVTQKFFPAQEGPRPFQQEGGPEGPASTEPDKPPALQDYPRMVKKSMIVSLQRATEALEFWYWTHFNPQGTWKAPSLHLLTLTLL